MIGDRALGLSLRMGLPHLILRGASSVDAGGLAGSIPLRALPAKGTIRGGRPRVRLTVLVLRRMDVIAHIESEFDGRGRI